MKSNQIQGPSNAEVRKNRSGKENTAGLNKVFQKADETKIDYVESRLGHWRQEKRTSLKEQFPEEAQPMSDGANAFTI